ncbi:anti-sigma factor [Hoeflea sp. WL0058]|uniref:Anti-sigma factor n=1 Tax=Flavimaribacter sediminis TaxID=2865987 RepID=A0AAE3D079_9HYPH|nr:anti-sigma factor [Flavimaribacter sediminis]MBW8636727.1 anti-sigma factor [Flavimaribacter sediminis]
MTERSLDDLIDEVVVGLASEEDCARIEKMAERDAEIAARLDSARMRYMALDETADELELPAQMWERVASDIATKQVSTEDKPPEIVDLTPAIRNRNRWRLMAIGSMAATIMLAVVLGWTLNARLEPTVIAVLLDAQGQPVALVEGARNNKTLVTLLEAARVPDNQVMQVWTKPDSDGPPVSLGLLPSERSGVLEVEGLPSPAADQLYEITFEPYGGSPTNLPTGPILGKGFAKTPVL